jgi:uncharacterized protein (TIGR04222 family)
MMDWLPQPFSSLSGPAFLLVYAFFAAAVIVVSRLQVTSADRSLMLPLPPVSAERDPFEVAYLRGGGNELLRFAIFEAIRRNVLRLAPPAQGKKRADRIEAVTAELSPGDASAPLFEELVKFYAQPHTTVELFASNLPAAAEAFGAARYGATLEAERFLTDATVRATSRRVAAYGVLALALFAGLRLLEAFSLHHRNVAFLIMETIFAVMALVGATRVGRLSRRGRAYVQRLQAALRPAAGLTAVAGGAAMLPIFVAASGMSALAGTEYAPVRQLFPRQASSGGCGSSSSGCGSGSGSSCGGGSGCGGGGCGG